MVVVMNGVGAHGGCEGWGVGYNPHWWRRCCSWDSIIIIIDKGVIAVIVGSSR